MRDFSAELAQQNKRKEDEANTLTSFSSHFNKYSPEDKTTLHHWSKDTNSVSPERMDKVIKKHNLPKETTLWSKSRTDPRGSSIVNHPYHMATTIYKNTATDYLKDHHASGNEHHILKITAPKDTHAAFIHDEDSINPKYKEVVLPRGSRFKYSHTDTQTNGKRIEHTHHMELLK